MSFFSRLRKRTSFAITGVALFSLIAVFANSPIDNASAAAAEKTPNLSKKEKMELVETGVAMYTSGELDQAKANLEMAGTVFPENIAVPYYLGLIYLQEGNRPAAITQWERYVAIDPESDNAQRIRKNITLLHRQEASAHAERILAGKAVPTATSSADKKVVVTTFEHIGIEGMGPLGKGTAAILMDDLSRIPGLEVVDRTDLIELLIAMGQGDSGLIVSEEMPRAGRLFGAGYVSSGDLVILEDGKLQIDSRLIDSNKELIVGTQQTRGELKEFFNLEKKIACLIAKDLGKDCNTAPPEFQKPQTNSLKALIAYSWGLEFSDEKKYDEARSMFRNALEEDPSFELAQKALLATPYTAMAYWSDDQMISTTAQNGLSAAAAASATQATAARRSATAEDKGGGFEIGKGKIIAGVVAVGLIAAVAGGGGGGGGGDDGNNTPVVANDLSGNWRGTWSGSGGSGDFGLNLSQSGSTLNGTLSITGTECLSAGTVSGNVNGNNVTLNIDSTAGTLQTVYNSSTYTMTGVLELTSNNCTVNANVSTSLTGGADVNW